MKRSDIIKDYILALIPTTVDMNDAAGFPEVLEQMEVITKQAVFNQYKKMPAGILFSPIDWLVTNDPQEMLEFQPDHDCEECRAGNTRGVQFLKDNPERYLICANIEYIEIWE